MVKFTRKATGHFVTLIEIAMHLITCISGHICMDSNIPANPAYGVYISQLVRYARVCTSKVDFMNRLRGLSLRLIQQGFETNLLQKSFNKFFNRHGLIVLKYGANLREMRLAIQA